MGLMAGGWGAASRARCASASLALYSQLVPWCVRTARRGILLRVPTSSCRVYNLRVTAFCIAAMQRATHSTFAAGHAPRHCCAQASTCASIHARTVHGRVACTQYQRQAVHLNVSRLSPPRASTTMVTLSMPPEPRAAARCPTSLNCAGQSCMGLRLCQHNRSMVLKRLNTCSPRIKRLSLEVVLVISAL
jgi:hypothetical protein